MQELLNFLVLDSTLDFVKGFLIGFILAFSLSFVKNRYLELALKKERELFLSTREKLLRENEELRQKLIAQRNMNLIGEVFK